MFSSPKERPVTDEEFLSFILNTCEVYVGATNLRIDCPHAEARKYVILNAWRNGIKSKGGYQIPGISTSIKNEFLRDLSPEHCIATLEDRLMAIENQSVFKLPESPLDFDYRILQEWSAQDLICSVNMSNEPWALTWLNGPRADDRIAVSKGWISQVNQLERHEIDPEDYFSETADVNRGRWHPDHLERIKTFLQFDGQIEGFEYDAGFCSGGRGLWVVDCKKISFGRNSEARLMKLKSLERV